MLEFSEFEPMAISIVHLSELFAHQIPLIFVCFLILGMADLYLMICSGGAYRSLPSWLR
jgi:hypothetical protein